jgi:hypothetical protein
MFNCFLSLFVSVEVSGAYVNVFSNFTYMCYIKYDALGIMFMELHMFSLKKKFLGQ